MFRSSATKVARPGLRFVAGNDIAAGLIPAAAGGPGTVTITGPGANPYEAFHVADNDTTDPAGCWYAGTNPADIVFAFTGTTKVREVVITARAGSPNNCPNQIKLWYSDDGSSYTQVDGAGYTSVAAFSAGQTQTFPSFSDAGTHKWWKLTCATPFSNDVSPVEMELHASIGGPDILVL